MVLTFESVDEILSYCLVDYHGVQGGSDFWVCPQAAQAAPVTQA